VGTTWPPEYLKGIEHFNRGEFFEAHEAWEAIWLETGGPLSDFYKGLIQCAVAIHHFRRGNLAGARRLYEGQRGYLSKFPAGTMGLDVPALLARVEALFAPLLAARPGERPAIEEAGIPKITLAGGG
jgi:hypothetical protein